MWRGALDVTETCCDAEYRGRSLCTAPLLLNTFTAQMSQMSFSSAESQLKISLSNSESLVLMLERMLLRDVLLQ